MAVSEVAQLRERIANEHLAAQRALSGLAFGTARHEFILRRMEQEAPRLIRLLQERKIDQVNQVIENLQREVQERQWEREELEEEGKERCHITSSEEA